MRVLKDDKYQSILHAARKEFIIKGFKDTSMRSIAEKANIGLSNIYNYFRNKDEIFFAIVNPAKEKLFAFLTEEHKHAYVDFENLSPFGHKKEVIEFYIHLIHKYKEEYRILLYHSQGSSMQNFRELLIEHMTKVSYEFMELEKNNYPDVKDVSYFFLHTMASWMVSILGEIVTHDLSRQKVRDFFHEYFRFTFAGWRELVGL